jgi:S1-C subfamily serine protease
MALDKRILTTACLLLGVLTVHGQAQNIDTARLFKQDSPAVVLIISQKSGTVVLGSGVLVSKDGTILSALHVVQGGDSTVVKLKSGDVYDKVSVIAFDARRDLVVLKISGFDLPVVPMGNSNDVREGDPVAIISNPVGLEGSISQGIVSRVRDISDVREGEIGFKVIQTTAATSPGSSGGAILNANGELIALHSFKVVGGENLNFGIPVNYARGMLDTHESFPLSQLASRIGGEAVKPVSQLAEAKPTDISGEWKSLLSGRGYRVRLEERHAYVEWALTDEQAKLGISQLCDLKAEGDGYRGACTSHWVGRWYDKWHQEWKARACQLQLRIEFNKVTPLRIEGRGEERGYGEKWSEKDVKNCAERLPTEWRDFVWIRPD